MKVPVKLPKHGLNMTTGSIIEMHVGLGDNVKKGDLLFEVETNKATLEVESEHEGTIVSVNSEEGDEVPVGEIVLILEVEMEDAVEEPQVQISTIEETQRPISKVLASPAARKLAKERNIDLSQVEYSGKAIEREDVERHLKRSEAIPTTVDPLPFDYSIKGKTKVERSKIKQLTGERLSYSFREIPHFSLRREVDLSALNEFIEERSANGDSISFNDVLVAAIGKTLAGHPLANASYFKDEVWLNPAVNVGYAVATSKGLVVPVIRETDKLDLSAVAATRRKLVGKALESKLSLEELEECTFTITNLGAFGVDSFTAIINPPQAAILSVGRFDTRIILEDGHVSEIPIVQLILSVDHRILDGSEAAAFFSSIVGYLAEPHSM